MTDKNMITIRVLDEEEVAVLPTPPPGTGVEQQALWHRRKTKDVAVETAKLADSLDEISDQVESVLQQRAQKKDSKFHLDSFEVGLAVSASGGFVLVAAVGIEASIRVTFKKSDS